MHVDIGSNGEIHVLANRTTRSPGRRCSWEVPIIANRNVRNVRELQTETDEVILLAIRG
jgi:hypothetical protein